MNKWFNVTEKPLKEPCLIVYKKNERPYGEIGKHEGLKIPWPNSLVGSSPIGGT